MKADITTGEPDAVKVARPVRRGADGKVLRATGVTRRRPTLHSSMIRPAEVLRPAVIEAVPSIIISHNHPSGDPTPSPEDAAITRELSQAAKLLGIELLDHVVIGGEKFVSLKERGLMS